jgi:integrase
MAMASGKITVSKLNDLQGWLWDDRVVGLGVRRQTKGCFYYLRYRRNGAQQMRSIGRHGSPWTPDTARQEALRLLGTLASGTDPFAETLSSEAFGPEVERYLERKRTKLKPRTFVGVEYHLRKQAAPLANLRLAEIDRRAIASLLAKIESDCGPIARNRLRTSLSAFFNFAIAEGVVEHNPVTGTLKVDEGGSRDRVLTVEEIRLLWPALTERPFADAVKLLLLTGMRRDEIGDLRWGEVDLTKQLIILPPARTKNNRGHTLPVSDQAAAILAEQPRRGEFVFGEGFNNWSTPKRKMDQRIGIAPWRIHDLRRTCATMMAELGVLPHHIEAVLNHLSGHKASVAGTYNRAKYLHEMRSALQRWADHIEALIVGPRKQSHPKGLMERAFAVARGGNIVPNENLANLARGLQNN